MKHISLPRLFQTKVVVCAGLVVLADVLLFGGRPWGASLAVFSAALLAAVVWLNGVHLKPAYMKAILALTAGLVFSFLLSPNLLAGGLFVAGLASLALLSRQAGVQSWQWVKDMLNVPALLLAQYYLDKAKLKKLQAKNKTKKVYSSLIGYVLFPAVFVLAFVYLFAKVNPAWQSVLDAIDIVALLSPRRWLFWIVAALVVWAFLRMRLPRGRMALSGVPVNLDFWISKNSVIISLVIFNILFAVQNGMDVAGFAGMADVAPTLAKQAQNAAYPLIFTVMLAALYVLLVFDDRQQKYHSRAAKVLTAIWVVQNIVLTFSAVYRGGQPPI